MVSAPSPATAAPDPPPGSSSSSAASSSSSSSLPNEKDLEALVKEQVAKVLINAAKGGGGAPGCGKDEKDQQLSTLLSGIDPAKIAELITTQRQQQQQQQEKDSSSLTGGEGEEQQPSTSSSSTITYDKHGRRLYLPPVNAPAYNPTPIE